ncbi:hypothetical protein GCM10010176_029440 [Nonomuraea spiralis]|nr:hypothetical protein GCM10010176_029440 [Nonomuraea spiralis]
MDSAQPPHRRRLRPCPQNPRQLGPAGARRPRAAHRHLTAGRPYHPRVRPRRPDPRPWVPIYDWAPTVAKTGAEWIADETDLPDVHEAVFDGRPSIVLSGTYKWDNGPDITKSTRGVWTHVYTHLVATQDLATAISELQGRDLLGQSIADNPEMRHGYAGEFPFGHHHGRGLHVMRHEWRQVQGHGERGARCSRVAEWRQGAGCGVSCRSRRVRPIWVGWCSTPP